VEVNLTASFQNGFAPHEAFYEND